MLLKLVEEKIDEKIEEIEKIKQALKANKEVKEEMILDQISWLKSLLYKLPRGRAIVIRNRDGKVMLYMVKGTNRKSQDEEILLVTLGDENESFIASEELKFKLKRMNPEMIDELYLLVKFIQKSQIEIAEEKGKN